MSKRKINIKNENKSFICGYKDGEKVVKLFQKDIDFNLKDYFDGLYNYYVNTLQSSYNFDNTVLHDDQKDVTFNKKSKVDSPYKSFDSSESQSTKSYVSFSFADYPKIEPTPLSTKFSFGESPKIDTTPPCTSFSFGESPKIDSIPLSTKFSFGESPKTDSTNTVPYKSFSINGFS